MQNQKNIKKLLLVNKNGWHQSPLTPKQMLSINSSSNYLFKLNEELLIKSKEDNQTELYKCCIRSVYRNSKNARIFTKEIALHALSKNLSLEDFYITKPYLLYHLPNDKKEEGHFHTDYLKGVGFSITSWTSLDNYRLIYPPLTLINRSHSQLGNLVYRLIRRFKITDRQYTKIYKLLRKKSIDIKPEANNTFIWDSNLIHKGNLNTGPKVHFAAAIRITELPLYYEPSIKIKDLLNDKYISPKNKAIDCMKLYRYANNWLSKIANHNGTIFNFVDEFYESSRNEIREEYLESLGFAFSIFAQRYVNEPYSLKCDLFSYLISLDNIVSLERFLMSLKKSEQKKILAKISEYRDFKSYQENFILHKLDLTRYRDLKNDNAIISW
jgi:hypothetical protein